MGFTAKNNRRGNAAVDGHTSGPPCAGDGDVSQDDHTARYAQYGMVRTDVSSATTGTNQPQTQRHLTPEFQEWREEQLRLPESDDHSRHGTRLENEADAGPEMRLPRRLPETSAAPREDTHPPGPGATDGSRTHDD